MELFHGRNVGKIGCSETSKRPELAHFPNDLLEACQLGLSQNEDTVSTSSAGLLLFQHLSWQILGLRPITKNRKVWIAIPSIKSNTFKDRPCPNVQQASANQSPFFKGLGFSPTKQWFPAKKKKHTCLVIRIHEKLQPKIMSQKSVCLSPGYFLRNPLIAPQKWWAKLPNPILKKVSNGLEKKNSGIGRKNPCRFQSFPAWKSRIDFPVIWNRLSLTSENGGNSKAVYIAFFRVGHLCIDNLLFAKYPQTTFEMFTQPYTLGADSIGVLNTFHLEHGRY